MLRSPFLFSLFSLLTLNNFAQLRPHFETESDLSLVVDRKTKADSAAVNGVAVTYNPEKKYYYTTFAGSAGFPLQVHDSLGMSIESRAIGYDVRGMWFDNDMLQGICYANTGGFQVLLNGEGKVKDLKPTTFSYNRREQSVGVFVKKKKQVMFVEDNTAFFYKRGHKRCRKMVTLVPVYGKSKYLNTNAPIYTGVRKYEIGLLDPFDMTVHLFNVKTGEETAQVILKPGDDVPATEFPQNFRVAYCNNRVFIYDTTDNTWSGFPMFYKVVRKKK